MIVDAFEDCHHSASLLAMVYLTQWFVDSQSSF